MIKKYEINLGATSSVRQGVLALGGHLKSSVCLGKGKSAEMLEFPGNLDEIETIKSFETEVKRLVKLENPRIIACDLHPEYLSTKLAESYKLSRKLIKVQHHHAHIASCMADNGVKEKVIGVAFDGTGLGTDGNIWGGEFLIAGYKDFKRAAHFEYIQMPGGETAIRQPWRMACSYLYKIFGNDFFKLDIDFVKKIDKNKWKVLRQMIDSKVNCPMTSSAGRLFDAVSALCGIRSEVEYEAQAAIELEKKIKGHETGAYGYRIIKKDKQYVVIFDIMFKEIIKDLKAKVDIGTIAQKFHNTIAAVSVDVCKRISRAVKIDAVCLSGGVFQNKYLLGKTVELLRRENFKVYTHKKVPTNDLGISLGQVVIANNNDKIQIPKSK